MSVLNQLDLEFSLASARPVTRVGAISVLVEAKDWARPRHLELTGGLHLASPDDPGSYWRVHIRLRAQDDSRRLAASQALGLAQHLRAWCEGRGWALKGGLTESLREPQNP